MPTTATLVVQVIGALASSSSWLTILLAVVLIVAFAKNEERWMKWLAKRWPQGTGRSILDKRTTSFVVLTVVSVILVSVAAVASTVNFLHPNVFIGYTGGSPLAFGRHAGSISRQTQGNAAYCGQAHVTGDLKNVTEAPLKVYYAGGSLKLWSTDPSVSFDFYPTLDGLFPDPNVPTTILPGQSVSLTLTGSIQPSICKDYKEESLKTLSSGRLNATGTLIVSGGDLKSSPTLFRFEDLPVANSGQL
jgi:hypothetical protein